MLDLWKLSLTGTTWVPCPVGWSCPWKIPWSWITAQRSHKQKYIEINFLLLFIFKPVWGTVWIAYQRTQIFFQLDEITWVNRMDLDMLFFLFNVSIHFHYSQSEEVISFILTLITPVRLPVSFTFLFHIVSVFLFCCFFFHFNYSVFFFVFFFCK